MRYHKWEIAWAGLDPTQGNEQAGRRPVLIFCNEAIAGPVGLAAIIPLTSWKENRRVYPTEVLLSVESTGLPNPSLALGHQLRTVSARRLSRSKHRLDDIKLRRAVVRAVSLWLDLPSPQVSR